MGCASMRLYWKPSIRTIGVYLLWIYLMNYPSSNYEKSTNILRRLPIQKIPGIFLIWMIRNKYSHTIMNTAGMNWKIREFLSFRWDRAFKAEFFHPVWLHYCLCKTLCSAGKGYMSSIGAGTRKYDRHRKTRLSWWETLRWARRETECILFHRRDRAVWFL